MKRVFLLTLLCCVVSTTFAQRKTITESWDKNPASEIYLPACVLPGKITYGYVIGDDGGVLKDGPVSIKCSLVNKKTYISPYTVTINGSYALNTTFSKGNLNGAFSSTYKTKLDGYIIVSKDAVNVSATMKGTFAKGVPNGEFRITRKGANYPTTVTANYKNGKLVGAFSASLMDEDAMAQKYSGSFTQSGKFTGHWTMNDVSADFINGVLISKRYNNKATKPAVSALARKYANGELTEEQVYEKGCVVMTETVKLGDLVRIAVFRDSMVEFDDLGGYDFSEPNHVTYKYLKEIATMTDEGVEVLITGIREFLTEEYSNTLSEMCSSSIHEYGILFGCIKTDENGKPYVYMHKNQNKGYAKGGFEGWYDDVYLSPEQMDHINQQAMQIIKDCISTFGDYVINEYYANHSKRELFQAYINGDKDFSSVEVTADNLDFVKSLASIIEYLDDPYQDYVEGKSTHMKELDVMIWKPNRYNSTLQYLSAKSIEEYKTLLDGLKADYEKLTASIEVIEQQVLKQKQEAEAKAKAEAKAAPVRNALNFMLEKKRSTFIAYNEELYKYFVLDTNDQYYQLHFSEKLKHFCPIEAVEFVGFEGENAIIKITKKRKKALITYQLSVPVVNGKLDASAFDKEKATIIE